MCLVIFHVFAQAREKARQTTCASNLKQIGLAIAQYVQDYDETLPYATLGVSPNTYDWGWAVNPYIKNGHTQSNNGYFTGGVWSCPDFSPVQTNEYQPNVNVMLVDGQWNACGQPEHGPDSLSVISTPSDTVEVYEAGPNGTPGAN